METTERDFVLRPNKDQKFRAAKGKSLLEEAVAECLSGIQYEQAVQGGLSDTLAADVNDRLKALNLPNYKYVTQVTISEQRGQAAHIMAQCVWDSDCDVMAHHYYTNNSLWCEVVVFAVFHY